MKLELPKNNYFDLFILTISIIFLIIGFIFSENIYLIIADKLGKQSAEKAIQTITIGMVVVAVRQIIKIMHNFFINNRQEYEITFNKVLSTFKTIFEEKFKKMDENFEKINIKVQTIDEKVTNVSKEVQEINIYRDVKKRREQDFEYDWKAIREDFIFLKEKRIFEYACLIKDAIKDFSIDVCGMELRYGDKETTLSDIKEKFLVVRSNLQTNIERILSEDFMFLCDERMQTHIDNYFKEIDKVLDDKINHRAEGIHIQSRSFLRKLLSTLYYCWVEYDLNNKTKENIVKSKCYSDK